MTSPFEPPKLPAEPPTALPPATPPLAPPAVSIPAEVGPPTMYPNGMPAANAGAPGLPAWIKVISVLLTVAKTLPLLVVVGLGVLFTGLASDIGPNWEDEIRGVGAVLIILAAVPFFVLILQAVGALWSKRMLLLIVSGFLAVIDVLITLASVAAAVESDGETAAGTLIAVVAAAQVAVFIGAVKHPTSG